MIKRSIYILFLLLLTNCSSKEEEVYTPTSASLKIPTLFQQKLIAPVIPTSNALTEEGIALGKKLFFDKILSKDNTQSCATCHDPKKAFTDSDRFSDGIDGKLGIRNSMPLFNLAWNFDERFTWDGKELSLERQALEPVRNPIEMHSKWINVAQKVQESCRIPNSYFNKLLEQLKIDSTINYQSISPV